MTLDLQEELQLVEAAKSDSSALGKLYDFYFPKVFAFVFAKVRDQSATEDLTSEAFLKIVDNIDRFEYRGVPFGAWVFRIVRNLLFDYYSKQKREVLNLDESLPLPDEKESSSPAKLAEQTHLKGKVAEVLKDLPERELSIIQLKFFAGLNNREIAAALNLTESNVGIIVFRVLKKIKPDLDKLI